MFTKLSPTDLARHRTTRSHPEYAEFLASLSVGEGGRVDLSKTGVKRQTVKNRLNSAAAGCGIKVKFVRSAADLVVFQVLGPSEEPKRRRGRPAKKAR